MRNRVARSATKKSTLHDGKQCRAKRDEKSTYGYEDRNRAKRHGSKIFFYAASRRFLAKNIFKTSPPFGRRLLSIWFRTNSAPQAQKNQVRRRISFRIWTQKPHQIFRYNFTYAQSWYSTMSCTLPPEERRNFVSVFPIVQRRFAT